MFRSGRRGSLIAALVALAVAAVSAAADDVRFSVGVLRRDGLLIPFTFFNGRTWTVPWPGPDANLALPISLSDVPKGWWGDLPPGTPWRAWLGEGAARPLTLGRPVQAPVFCAAHLAVGTDYRGEAPTERAPTVAKDGIAIAGDVPVKPIVPVSLAAQDAAALLAGITSTFNSEETLAAQHFTQWRHPFAAPSRARQPIQLEAFYRGTDTTNGTTFRTSYIEAVRRYPALAQDAGCGLLSYGRGWITEVPGKKPIINLGVRITYCDRAEVSFMQPFGRLDITRGSAAVRGVYWVYQLSSWREEIYSVARVAPDGVKPVVVVIGGACPKDPSR
jgi:hypothetical protein